MKYIYTGWFISPEEINGKLAKQIATPHITLTFKPDNAFEDKFGAMADIEIVGYGNDGENEGYLCNVYSYDTFLAEQAKQIKIPHITISVSANGKPVNTAKIKFSPIPKFHLIGIYGGFTSKGIVIKKA